jgi:HSP20 family molecular chaperone IbpA
MSLSALITTLRSSDHDFIAALRFLEDYAKHVHERGHQHQVYHNFVPRFDLEQHGDAYELYGELPGFRREDIIIEAHDDRNLQVSGSVSLLTTRPPPPSESKGSKDVTDPSAKAQDQNAPKEACNGEEPKSTQEPAPAAEAPEPTVNPLEAITTRQERYLNARFGDVLNPTSGFDNFNSTEASPEAKDDEKSKVRRLISERHPSSFHRAFHFPTPIRKDEVTATMRDGILRIRAPRAPMPPPVKVQVKKDIAYQDDFMVV